jgi:hypothetical protein
VFNAASSQHDLPGAKQEAATYRTALFTWDAAVRKLSFPGTARLLLNPLPRVDSTEIADLDAVAPCRARTG